MAIQKLNIPNKTDNAAKKKLVQSNTIGANETLMANEVNAIVTKVNEVVDATNNFTAITGFNFKENKSTYADLASIVDPQKDDAYGVLADGLIYIYNGESWPTEGNGLDLGLKPTGTVAEGVQEAVSGGEVYKNIDKRFVFTTGEKGNTFKDFKLKIESGFLYDNSTFRRTIPYFEKVLSFGFWKFIYTINEGIDIVPWNTIVRVEDQYLLDVFMVLDKDNIRSQNGLIFNDNINKLIRVGYVNNLDSEINFVRTTENKIVFNGGRIMTINDIGDTISIPLPITEVPMPSSIQRGVVFMDRSSSPITIKIENQQTFTVKKNIIIMFSYVVDGTDIIVSNLSNYSINGLPKGLGNLNSLYNNQSNREWKPFIFNKNTEMYTESVSDGFSINDPVKAMDLIASDINDMYDDLMSEFPNHINKTTLGNDYVGNEINLYTFDYQRPSSISVRNKPTVFITAGIHGSEKMGILGTFRSLSRIWKNDNNHPRLENLKKSLRICIIPLVNPSGFNRHNRLNTNNVDLNRNFSWKWEEYVGLPGTSTYKGTSPFSEIETQYVRDVFDSMDNLVAHIDVHNYTVSGIDAEWSWLVSHNNVMYDLNTCFYDKMDVIVRNKYPSVISSGYSSKSFISPMCSAWMVNEKNVISATFETNEFNPLDSQNINYSAVITAYTVECLINYINDIVSFGVDHVNSLKKQ